MNPSPSTTALLLRNLNADDLTAVPEWHMRHFPHSFYVRLGSGFITRYYQGYLASSDAAALAVRPRLWPDFVQRRAGWYARWSRDTSPKRSSPTPHGCTRSPTPTT